MVSTAAMDDEGYPGCAAAMGFGSIELAELLYCDDSVKSGDYEGDVAVAADDG